jgi:DNA polymerase-1
MNEESGPILLVDAYNVFARAYCVVPIMSSHGHHLGGTIGFLKSLSMYAEKFRPSKIIVCWEGGGSARRRKILPEYKLNRKPIKLNRSEIYEDIPNTEENFQYQIALTVKLLNNLPVHQMYVDECEADDIIGYIARYKFLNEKKLIISMDQDFHQLLGDNCQQYSPASKKILDSNYVLQRYGVSVENFITARSFIGDTSDGIPGIKGAGFKSLFHVGWMSTGYICELTL